MCPHKIEVLLQHSYYFFTLSSRFTLYTYRFLAPMIVKTLVLTCAAAFALLASCTPVEASCENIMPDAWRAFIFAVNHPGNATACTSPSLPFVSRLLLTPPSTNPLTYR